MFDSWIVALEVGFLERGGGQCEVGGFREND